MFRHVQQSTNSVLEDWVALQLPYVVLLCFLCCIMYGDKSDFIPEDNISPHTLLTDALCPGP